MLSCAWRLRLRLHTEHCTTAQTGTVTQFQFRSEQVAQDRFAVVAVVVATTVADTDADAAAEWAEMTQNK